MTNRVFACAYCQGVYQSNWTKKEARAAAIANGLDPDDEHVVLVCDYCYQAVGLLQSMMPGREF